MDSAAKIMTVAVVLAGAAVIFVWSILAAYGLTQAIVALHKPKEPPYPQRVWVSETGCRDCGQDRLLDWNERCDLCAEIEEARIA